MSERNIPFEHISKFIYMIKRNFPENEKFYYILFSIKFLGLICSTQNVKSFEDDENIRFSLHSVLSKFFLFHYKYSIIIHNYQLICICIFIFLIIYIGLLIIDYYIIKIPYKNVKSNFDYKLNKIEFLTLKNKINIYNKILAYIFIIILFTSQHIVEYVFFSVYFNYINDEINLNSSKYNEKNISYLQYYISNEKNKYINGYILTIINLITIIIINVFNYIFMTFNQIRNNFSNYGVGIFYQKKIIILTTLLFNIQPFCTLNNIYSFHDKNRMKSMTNNIISSYLLLWLLLQINKFSFYPNNISKFIFRIICFCFFSGLNEIFIFNFIKKFTQSHSFLKLIVEFIGGLFLSQILLKINKKFFINFFIKNLFNSELKKISIGESYYFFEILVNYLNDENNNYLNIYKILLKHCDNCQFLNCPCKQLIDKKIYNQNINSQIYIDQKIIKKEQFLIIYEQELLNKIHILYNFKKQIKLEYYCILHIIFEYKIKKSYNFALYLIGKYTESNFNLSILAYYYFYEFKKSILKELFLKQKKIYSNLTLLQNQNKKNLDIYKFILKEILIKKILLNSCLNLNKIMLFKSEFNKNHHNKTDEIKKLSFSVFIKYCVNIKENNNRIEKILNLDKNKIINCELSYLLTNYYSLLFNKIPFNLIDKFEHYYNYYQIINKIEFDYSNFNMKYPLIINLCKNDIFEINYINSILCENLEYTKEELIGKNFYILIPKNIGEIHKYLLKLFLFIPNGQYKAEETFLVNKNNYLINCNLYSKTLPNFKPEYYVINNIFLNNEIISNYFYYNLIIDDKFQFDSISKNFEENFFFSLKMLNLLKINFCEFFGININKFKKKISNFKTKSCKYDFQDLKEINKSLTVFSNINQKFFEFKNISNNLNDFIGKVLVIEEKIKKNNISKGLNNLTNYINELGLDIEWYNKVKLLGDRLKINLNEKKSKNTFEKKNSFYKNRFFIKYKCKNICNVFYYLIYIKEYKDNENFKKTKEININQSFIKNNLIKLKVNGENLKKINEIEILKNNMEDNDKAINIANNSIDNSKMNLFSSSQNVISILNKNNEMKNKFKKKKTKNSKNKNNFSNYNQNVEKPKNENFDMDNELFINDINIDNKLNYIKKIRYIFIILIFIFFLISIILISICLILTIKEIEKGSYLLKCQTNIQLLKEDIYVASLNSLFHCDDYPKTNNMIEVLQLVNNIFADEAFLHYAYILYYQKKLTKYSLMNNFIKILYEKKQYFKIDNVWKVNEKKNGILEEIYLFIYQINNIFVNNQTKCKFEVFYGLYYYLNPEETKKTYGDPTELDKVISYIFLNLLRTYKIVFENLISEVSNTVINNFKEVSDYVIYFNISIATINFISALIYIFIIYLYYKETKIYLSFLYLKNEKVKKLESNNLLFINVLKEFNSINIINFEKNFLNNKLNIEEDLEINEKNLIKSSNNRTALEKLSVLKININNNNNNNNKNQNEKNNIEFQNQNYKKNKILPITYLISFLLSIILFLITLILLISNIILTSNTKDLFIYAVIMIINHLDRVPKLVELLFFTIFKIISGSIDVIGARPSDFYLDNVLNYYKIKLSYEKNSIIEKLKNHYFSNLLLENLLIEEYLLKFDIEKKKVLNNLREVEKNFNVKGYFCISLSNSVYDYLNLGYDDLNIIFNVISLLAKNCHIANPKISDYGLISEMYFIFQEIVNFYEEFIRNDVDNITIKNNFLTNADFVRMINNVEIPLSYLHKTYSYYITDDIDDLINEVIMRQTIFSIIFYLMLFFTIALQFYFIIKNNFYNCNLSFFSKIFQN